MTRQEFAAVTSSINDLWGERFDQGKQDTWYRLLSGLQPARLMLTLDSLVKDPPVDERTGVKELRFAPKIAQILDRYEELRGREARLARDRAIKDQRRLLKGAVYPCAICRNRGDVFFERDGYVYHCRCSCEMGRDLMRWSRGNITKGSTWLNPRTQQEECIYYPDVNDVLDAEELEIIKARNAASR